MAVTTLDRPSPPAGPVETPSRRRISTGSITGGLRWIVRGRAESAVWERPALLGLLAVTALLYLWDLSSSGWANSFYSAAAQAGSQSWKAFFFGSSDAGSPPTLLCSPARCWRSHRWPR